MTVLEEERAGDSTVFMDKQHIHQTHGEVAERLKRGEGHLRSMVEIALCTVHVIC